MARTAQAVAAVATAAVVACVWLVFEAGRRAYETIGPSKAVAARDGSLYVMSHGAVHVFDSQGKRTARYELAQMGAPRVPSDLAVHNDGRLVIADPEENRVLVCVPSRGPCAALLTGLHRAPGKADFTHNSSKVSIDEERRRYYVADNAGHRVLIVGFDGRIVVASAPNVVWYPNELRKVSAGELMVVDTNHHRIAFFDVSGDKLGRVARSMPTGSSVARPGRIWPFDAVRLADGDTWALVAVNGMKDADIVVFDVAGQAKRRVDLGGDMDPFALDVWNGRVIVSDATRYRLDAIDPTGAVQPAVTDAGFLAELDAERNRFRWWKRARTAAQAGIGIIPLLAILALWRLGVPLRRVPQAAPVEDIPQLGEHPHWIEVDPAYMDAIGSSVRRASIAMGVIALAFAGWFWWKVDPALFANPVHGAMLAVLLLFPVIVIAMPWLTQRFTLRSARATRLGAARGALHYEIPAMQAKFWRVPPEGQVPWDEVHFDGRRLLAGRVMLMVRPPLGKPPLFEPREFERWIVAGLPASGRVSPGQLTNLLLRRQQWLKVVFFLIFAALLATLALHFAGRSL